jgi:hypothetical protein
MVNENGTEALVTPYGTLTSLPAHTGVVTADLTRNLSELGKVAPELVEVVDQIEQSDKEHVNDTNWWRFTI